MEDIRDFIPSRPLECDLGLWTGRRGYTYASSEYERASDACWLTVPIHENTILVQCAGRIHGDLVLRAGPELRRRCSEEKINELTLRPEAHMPWFRNPQIISRSKRSSIFS